MSDVTELSAEQLSEYFCEHVRYEIQLLLNATVAIDQKMTVPAGLEFMPVESFAIHLRNLVTFFYPNNPRPTDVSAKNFFIDENSWLDVRPVLCESLKIAKTRADVEVGHLTTYRKNGTPDSKAWDVKGLTAELVPIIVIFAESADKVKLDTVIGSLLSHYSYVMKLKPK